MHPPLAPIVAQQRIADLRRAADHDRHVQTATTTIRSDAPTGSGPVAAAPVTLIRRLRHHLAQHTRPHGNAGQVEG